MSRTMDPKISEILTRGAAIPAHPLALTAARRLDERRQRALTRYYVAAGVDGIAVGVHTTQFSIRDPHIGLFEPVLSLAAEEMNRADLLRIDPLLRIGGICGDTNQAVREAGLLADLGYHSGLLSLAALKDRDEAALVNHCRSVAQIIPVTGFYLQPSVGGQVLSSTFWRKFAEIDNVVAIKIAPFNRYQTLDVMRAVCESGRNITIYTGNDDNILMDLVTPYSFLVQGKRQQLRMKGGLLGHWSVWTHTAVHLFHECQELVHSTDGIHHNFLQKSVEVTDTNAAFFDVANGFAGCIAGLHEVLRRQGLLEGIWCLDPNETLGKGQKEEIDRVYEAYPHLNDDSFVQQHLDKWLAP
ncbi:dihydrodipicolinate synthase family protein [Granulicella sp. dw_53]|uniref:dihydrodipicolinate synthase family protein n=1 Tax=Granulicella sp. dw_53 TaxID=2719792 RepID=UPI0021029233|nr:dihydrodipicolinate synthase family protein [Granulicella sp. dw_53]